jgi:hypothetical protein
MKRVSLDAPVKGAGVTLAESLGDERIRRGGRRDGAGNSDGVWRAAEPPLRDDPVEELLGDHELAQIVEVARRELKGRTATVFEGIYIRKPPRTFAQLAHQFGISITMVTKIRDRACAALRRAMALGRNPCLACGEATTRRVGGRAGAAWSSFAYWRLASEPDPKGPYCSLVCLHNGPPDGKAPATERPPLELSLPGPPAGRTSSRKKAEPGQRS